MPLHLIWLDQTKLAVEIESLTPEGLSGLSLGAIRHRLARVGNTQAELGSLFRVEGEPDGSICFEGDVSHVRGIGENMRLGSVEVRGNAGPRLGSKMSGGLIEVHGSVDVWAGAEMAGGLLKVHGNAKDYLGAALPGSRSGMREGIIVVHGNTGDDAGLGMRRGLIAVGGKAGKGFGRAMIAGTAVALGGVGEGAGSTMKRGTLSLFHVNESNLLPTFMDAGRYRPPFWTIYARRLMELGLKLPPSAMTGIPARYNGDLAGGGQGEVLLWD